MKYTQEQKQMAKAVIQTLQAMNMKQKQLLKDIERNPELYTHEQYLFALARVREYRAIMCTIYELMEQEFGFTEVQCFEMAKTNAPTQV